MGTTCCRQGDDLDIQIAERPETGLTLSAAEEVCENSHNPYAHAATAFNSPTKASTADSLSRYNDHADQITKIQGLFRGAILRKVLSSGSLLRPKGIIKYITNQMRRVTKITTSPSYNMEPFEVDWDISSYKNRLELRKMVTDDKGNTYIGYWNRETNQKEGYGQELYSNGAKYEGFWLNGEYDGKGRLVHPNGDFYAGMWRHGKAEGFGTFIGVDGMKYIGEWKAGEHHGKGQEIWTDGSIFEGNYVNADKEGFGKFVWCDKSYYEGNFSKSMMTGEGKYVWNDGRVYTGSWKENKMHGKGTFTFSSGKTYVGEFVEDQRQGMGKMTWPDGKYYEGEWEAGTMHGKGKMCYPDGTIKEGEWEKGKESTIKKNGKIQPTPLFTLIPLDMGEIKGNNS